MPEYNRERLLEYFGGTMRKGDERRQWLGYWAIGQRIEALGGRPL